MRQGPLTQEDKGHVRWTMFGGSEQGPSRGFWKSFYSAPGVEVEAEHAEALLAIILVRAYGEPGSITGDLKSARVRIMPDMPDDAFPDWRHGQLPSAQTMLLGESESLDGVRCLSPVRQAATAASGGVLRGKARAPAVSRLAHVVGLTVLPESTARTAFGIARVEAIAPLSSDGHPSSCC
jgi:hypothetical protein